MIERLAIVAAGGLEDLPELQAAIKKRRAEREEPIDRQALRSALEQRSKDWRQRLRSNYPDEARCVVRQLIGPLKLWFATKADVEQGDYLREHFGFALREAESDYELSEAGLTAVVTPLDCSAD